MNKYKNKESIDKEIIIALIGVIGPIIAAVITGIFMIIQVIISPPPKTTKSVESYYSAPLYNITPTVNITKTVELSESTHFASPLPSVSPLPNVEATTIITPRVDILSELMDNMQWRSYYSSSSLIITGNPFWGCNVPVLLRRDISTDKARSCEELPLYNNNSFDLFVPDVILPTLYIQKNLSSKNYYESEFFPQKTNGVLIHILLSSDKTLYLKPSLKIQIERTSLQIGTERGVRFCIGGGGGMNFYYLDPIDLQSQSEIYQVERSFGIENPFYVLDAGGMMVIAPFVCRDLGAYRITFFAIYRLHNIPEEEKIEKIFTFSLVCPQQFKIWTLPEYGGVVKYTWDEKEHLYLRVDTLP